MAGNTLIRYEIFLGADLSVSQISSVTGIQFLDNLGMQINITSGTATGQFDVEVSSDYAVSEPGNVVTNGGTWGSIASPLINLGLPSPTLLNLNQVPFPFMRLIWTPASGSGTCDAYIVGKSI
jgi:hypothetical protein